MPTDIPGNYLQQTIELVRKLKDSNGKPGAIFYDKIRPANAGTGTTRASISTTYQIPQRAVEIIAVKPQYVTKATIAAVGAIAEFDIQGQAFGYQPMNFFSTPQAAQLGAIAAPSQGASEWWETRIPVAPGDTYDWGVTPQFAVAANARAGMEIMYSTVRTGLAPIYSFAQTVQTIVATVAGDQSGGTLQLPQADKLLEIAHYALPNGVQVAGDTLSGDMTYACASLTPVQSIRVGLEPQPPGVGATFCGFLSGIRREVTPGLSFNIQNPVITLTCNVDTAITNTSQFSALARYTKVGVVASPPKV